MSKVFNINAKLASIHPLVNGSFSLIFKSKELDRDTKNSILDFHQLEGSLVFTEKDTKINIVESSTEQSIHQRLRAKIYSLYETTDKKITAEEYYIQTISNLINDLENK